MNFDFHCFQHPSNQNYNLNDFYKEMDIHSKIFNEDHYYKNIIQQKNIECREYLSKVLDWLSNTHFEIKKIKSLIAQTRNRVGFNKNDILFFKEDLKKKYEKYLIALKFYKPRILLFDDLIQIHNQNIEKFVYDMETNSFSNDLIIKNRKYNFYIKDKYTKSCKNYLMCCDFILEPINK